MRKILCHLGVATLVAGGAAVALPTAAHAASCGQRTDVYSNIGTYYPFDYAGRHVGLKNGTQRNYTFATATNVRRGDVLVLQRGSKTFTVRWVTTAQVSGSSYITCSGSFSGSGANYIQTPSIENWHVPIRACIYPVEGGYHCHDRWYVDIT
ncbi:hypothetical protein [Herbidospora daliensis]|uniref:hypothetical protein n=1 Tax=Herbidospora daliensis TaxID=295585 RepID=UPI00078438BE|nr:hypothetical protein [Herbidospora daliensis]